MRPFGSKRAEPERFCYIPKCGWRSAVRTFFCKSLEDWKTYRKFAPKIIKETIMATLVLHIPDESLVQKVKQACKMLVGVASVKVQKDAKPKEYDITKTAGYREAMDDVKNGRVYHADSVDDMFKQILG